MTSVPREPLEDDWARNYVLGSDELRATGANLNTYPGAVFLVSADAERVLKVSRNGINDFGLSPDILQHLYDGRINKVFFPEGLRRIRPKVERLIESQDRSKVARAVLEYRAHRHPRYVHVALRLLPDQPEFFGLAQYLPPASWPANVIHSKAREFRKQSLYRFRMLTSRERDVLRHVISGKTNPEIAEALEISVNTVKTHKKNVNVKLDIDHFGDLIKYAVAFDLVDF